MPLSCFARGRGRAGEDPTATPPPPSSSSTSVYWTHLGAVSLTWSRASLGLHLTAELRLDDDDGGAAPARFAFRPWLPWRWRGCRRFAAPCGRVVAFSWDLSRARLAAGRPEPVSRYSLHVRVDGELALAAGDLALLSSSSASSVGFLMSRRETAVVDAGRGEAYTTAVAVDGEEHEVSLAVQDDAGAAMWVAVDGEKALQVRRLRWKFRGSERLDLPRGRVRVTWDLHGWLFSSPDAAAVFVLRFETDDDAKDADDDDDDVVVGAAHVSRQSSFRDHHHHATGGGESWCSSDSERRGWRRGGPFRSSSDTSPSVSVVSTSSTSTGSVATVSQWAVPDAANALKDGSRGFSLVVHLWKKRK